MLGPDEHMLDYVDAYLHEALSTEDARTLAEHCDTCPICSVALEEARHRREAMGTLPAVEASEELIRTTQLRISEYRNPWVIPAWTGAGAAVVALVVLISLTIYAGTLRPTPYDLKILGQSELLTGSETPLRVLLVDHRSGDPVEGIAGDVELLGSPGDDVIHLASFTTDRWGSASPRLKLPEWEDGEYRLRVSARIDGGEERLEHAIRLRRSWQLMLTSDKPVYRPGGVIQLRGLALARPDRKPVAGRPLSFSVTDPKGNVIFRRSDPTSPFGIASAECPLAEEILHGIYKIQCSLGDTTSTISVEVKEYVLPKFRIDVELDRPFYQPGEVVRGSLQVDYFFGKPVAGADVEVAVVEDDAEPRCIEEMALQTGADGSGEFEYRVRESLIGLPQNSGNARLKFVVTVRDTASQKQTRSVGCLVTANPLHVEVIPESGDLVRGEVNKVYFFTSFADGRPAPTRIAVTGVDHELVTNALGVAVLEITPETEELDWTIRVTDSAGRIGRREVTLRCGTVTGDFLVRPDKAVYDAGQTMQLLALGGGVEPVFIDLIQDGQTILSDMVDMHDGRGEYAVDLPPERFGTLQLCAYRFADDGLPVRKVRVIHVRPSRQLKVIATTDRQQYRPGDRARLAFAVTDADGNPAPGALSLSAVDEAVFSVLPQRPGVEAAFFATEQELLEPVYAIYPWTPDLHSSASTEDEEQLHRALLARAGRDSSGSKERLKAFIDEFCEGDESILRVLERPDWEEMAQSMDLPEELIAMLQGQGTPHTLNRTSFAAKKSETDARKRVMESRVAAAWKLLGVVLLIAFLAAVARSAPAVISIVLVLFVGFMLLLPAVQMTREAARRASATNNLKQLHMGFEWARSKAELPADQYGAEPSPVRLRQWFPETLLWTPELITDDQGRATLELDLADSITTWRLSASAVTKGGALGGGHSEIRVFQPFFVEPDLPVALTRGDEVTLNVAVYNYLDRSQEVELTLSEAPWLELLDEAAKTIELAAEEVRSVSFRIRAARVGQHELRIDARGGEVADAVLRPVEVVPDGHPIEQVLNGTLARPAEIEIDVPTDAIEGSAAAVVKIYPSSFSQLVEGLDAVFQRPYGCFEQTTATTYPNVLALDYLRRTKKSLPAVEAKAQAYIHLGYQRLLTFEVAGGGFDWFGRGPANRTLTACGLMEFRDMARVHDVDPNLISRTRRWLLDQQQTDGSWQAERRSLHDVPSGGGRLAELGTTAYIGWAVFGGGANTAEAVETRGYLTSIRPDEIDDPYTLALVCNALSATGCTEATVRPYLDRLDRMKRTSADGKLTYWQRSGSNRTMFYGAGRSGNIETTALAVLALVDSGRHPQTTRKALAWLAAKKDAAGTWHSTQATVLALKALLAGTGKPLGGEVPRRIEIALDGEVLEELSIPADQADVTTQVSLSKSITSGKHTLRVTEQSDTAAGYQFALRYHVPDAAVPKTPGPLSIAIEYDRTALAVHDEILVTATVTNHRKTAAPMVMLDLPVPAGFAVTADVGLSPPVAKVQHTARSMIVYLRQLKPGKPLRLQYRLRATMPVKVTAAGGRVYEYYDPDTVAVSMPERLIVVGRGEDRQ